VTEHAVGNKLVRQAFATKTAALANARARVLDADTATVAVWIYQSELDPKGALMESVAGREWYESRCAICGSDIDPPGFTASPIASGDCCTPCHLTLVLPLRAARLIGRDGAERVAEFALMLARQRARLSPAPVKEVAHIIAQGLISHAVERLYAEEIHDGA
jgi:hypothetical protein